MTRGRYPDKAIDRAEKIAGTRGEVRYYERGPGLHPHFSIVATNILAEVIMKITDHINAPLAQLEAEAAAEIGCMKTYPASQQISREIWFSSQNYSRRYFRITGTGLIELSPDGNLLPIDVAKIGTGAGGTAGTPAPAAAAAGSPASPGARPEPAPEHSNPASPDPASSPGSPAPVARGETTHVPAHPPERSLATGSTRT